MEHRGPGGLRVAVGTPNRTTVVADSKIASTVAQEGSDDEPEKIYANI